MIQKGRGKQKVVYHDDLKPYHSRSLLEDRWGKEPSVEVPLPVAGDPPGFPDLLSRDSSFDSENDADFESSDEDVFQVPVPSGSERTPVPEAHSVDNGSGSHSGGGGSPVCVQSPSSVVLSGGGGSPVCVQDPAAILAENAESAEPSRPRRARKAPNQLGQWVCLVDASSGQVYGPI